MKLKIPDTITEDELAQIMKAVKKKSHRLAFALGFYACMRVSEVVNLKPEHIDRDRKVIRIKEAKGGKDRNIPLPPQLYRGLNGLPLGIGVRALQIAFKNAAAKTIQKDVHFHTLRHSGATYYLNKKGWSTRQVQAMLGHSRIQTTEIYTHVTPDDLINKMWGEK